VIRHARAAAARPDLTDAERALTPEGAARFERTARGLARLLEPPTALLTSPLLRARQTAALCGAAWGGIVATAEPALASGSVDAILEALRARRDDTLVTLVGHEPTVSQLVAELLGLRGEAIAFAVGTAALVDVLSLSRRSARLVWFLPPAVTEALGSTP
jgi:phosphohistidine phosphatase